MIADFTARSWVRVCLVLPLVFAWCGGAAARSSDDPVDLRSALARTLAHHPALAAFPWQERMADGELLQAGLRPNPVLGAELENFAGTGELSGVDSAVFSLRLSQLIELGGKRDRRSGVALAQRELLQADYEIVRLEVLAEATRRFIAVARQQALLELAQRHGQLAADTVDVVQQRAEAGRGSPVATSQARIGAARAAIEQEHAEHELASARVRLATSWNQTTPDFSRVSAELFTLPELPPFDELAEHLAQAPSLSRYLTLERVRAAQLRLAQAEARPDIELGVGLRRVEDIDEHALLLELSLPLPIHDRNQGRIQSAQARQAMTTAEQDRVRLDLFATLFALYQELIHARTESRMLREDILPEAATAMRQVEEGFRNGRFSWLELATLRREHLAIEREAIHAAARFHTLLLEVEQLTGQPFTPAARATDAAGGQ